MFKKTLFFLFSALFIFIVSFIFILGNKNEKPDNNPYYKISNERFNSRTTIVHKEQLKETSITTLLAKDKITDDFVAKTDNLGIISIPFDTHSKSVSDKIIFRLKQTGKLNWYYETTYNADQIQNNIPFPFGFPIILNSKNVSYTFEIESLNGKPGDSLSLNKTNNYFLSEYKFSKADLIKNPSKLVQFFVAKMDEQLSLLTLMELMIILVFSIFLPIVILIVIGKWTRDTGKLILKSTKKYIVKFIYKQNLKLNEHDYKDVLVGFLITFSIIASIVLLAGILSFPLTGQRKWIPYLIFLIPSVTLSIIYFKIKLFKKRYFSVFAFFIVSVVLTLGVLNYGDLSWFGISGILITCCYLPVMYFMKYKHFSLISAGTLIFLFSINSIVFVNGYGTQNIQNYIWTALVLTVIMYAFLLLLEKENRSTLWSKVNRVGFIVLLIISFLLSLRSDSLFLGSSEYHWGYFTGVIQTIRSGGELLWSTPSQYGFLNVLLPSVLPWTSRNSFFIFQAVLFFICAFILIKTIYLCFNRKAAFIFISLTALSLFYFADPAIIGPTLYPSSSAVRFFPVYVLIYTILLGYYKRNILNGRIKWLAMGVYVFGTLWSAEGMLYCTVIYTSYLLASAIAVSKLKKNNGLKFLFKNVSAVFIAFITVNLLYLGITHHLPDWSMYFMYAFGYANGFGEFVIKPGGIFWALVIALSGIVFTLSRLYHLKKYSEWIVVSVCFTSLWVLASYFVGRAVTNNLTAILPLIFYIFIVVISVLMKARFSTYRLLLTSIFLPWIIVGVMGGIGNPQFLEKIQTFKFAQDINSKSFKPDRELSNIFKSLEVAKGTPIAYYGDLNNNPLIPFNGDYLEPIAGVPMPLILLEEPVSENKRALIMKRFFSKLNKPVFLIHRKKEYLGRFSSWKKFFVQNYIMEKQDTENGKYEVYLLKRK